MFTEFELSPATWHLLDSTLSQHQTSIPCLCPDFPANTRRWPKAGLRLAHSLRRWANIIPALGQRFVFAGNCDITGDWILIKSSESWNLLRVLFHEFVNIPSPWWSRDDVCAGNPYHISQPPFGTADSCCIEANRAADSPSHGTTPAWQWKLIIHRF